MTGDLCQCGHWCDDDDMQPSCGAHVLCEHCAPWTTCRECVRVQKEASE